MSRRPLGGQLPPDVRAIVLERRVRELNAAIEELEVAMETVHTGTRDGRHVSPSEAQSTVWQAFVGLQELKGSPIRWRETVRRSTTDRGAGR